jgi:uncharacterized RDD family membrane protein YckC
MTMDAVPGHAAVPVGSAARATATAVDYSLGAAAALCLWLLVGRTRTAPVSGLTSSLLLTGPLTSALAALEATGGSPGKRLLGLQVVHSATAQPVGLVRATARTFLKVAVPWELAHAAVWRLRSQGAPERARGGVPLLLACYAYTGASLVGVVRSGQGLHDRATGTRVAR